MNDVINYTIPNHCLGDIQRKISYQHPRRDCEQHMIYSAFSGDLELIHVRTTCYFHARDLVYLVLTPAHHSETQVKWRSYVPKLEKDIKYMSHVSISKGQSFDICISNSGHTHAGTTSHCRISHSNHKSNNRRTSTSKFLVSGKWTIRTCEWLHWQVTYTENAAVLKVVQWGLWGKRYLLALFGCSLWSTSEDICCLLDWSSWGWLWWLFSSRDAERRYIGNWSYLIH